jgi:hypothetical protein
VNDPVISFAYAARAADLTPHAICVLRDIMRAAHIPTARISSTARSPADQARVMFQNCEQYGAGEQEKLYRAPGQAVIAVYVNAKRRHLSPAATIDAMRRKIIELGPGNVSHHCADPKTLSVFDVEPSSVSDRAAFEAAARSDPRVGKLLTPDDHDPAFHFEIPHPAGL